MRSKIALLSTLAPLLLISSIQATRTRGQLAQDVYALNQQIDDQNRYIKHLEHSVRHNTQEERIQRRRDIIKHQAKVAVAKQRQKQFQRFIDQLLEKNSSQPTTIKHLTKIYYGYLKAIKQLPMTCNSCHNYYNIEECEVCSTHINTRTRLVQSDDDQSQPTKSITPELSHYKKISAEKNRCVDMIYDLDNGIESLPYNIQYQIGRNENEALENAAQRKKIAKAVKDLYVSTKVFEKPLKKTRPESPKTQPSSWGIWPF